jgi:RND family efflux transporter MFP subunit
MRKVIAVISIIAVVGAIVVTLQYNKRKMKEMARIDQPLSYPVVVARAEKRTISDSLSQVGEIVSQRDVMIIAEAQGRVTGVYIDTGSYVSAGQAMLKIDDELPKAGYMAAQFNYEKAKKDLERFEVLHKEEVISDSQYETARLAFKAAEADYTAARRQYHNSVIVSPISGLISERYVSLGATVAPGTVVANVVDITALKVRMNVAEQDAFRFKTGDPAVIETDVYPGVKFAGKIKSISAKGDAAHSFAVETSIVYQKDYPLRAGIFGRVTVNRGNPDQALMIPREALIGSIRQPQIFTVKNGVAKLRDIVVSREFESQVVVDGGLREGELVVVNGQDNLDDNMRVTIQKTRSDRE